MVSVSSIGCVLTHIVHALITYRIGIWWRHRWRSRWIWYVLYSCRLGFCFWGNHNFFHSKCFSTHFWGLSKYLPQLYTDGLLGSYMQTLSVETSRVTNVIATCTLDRTQFRMIDTLLCIVPANVISELTNSFTAVLSGGTLHRFSIGQANANLLLTSVYIYVISII